MEKGKIKVGEHLKADVCDMANPADVEKSTTLQTERRIVPPSNEADTNDVWKAPNGGFEAWLQVAAGFFLSMNSWGLVNTYGVYQTYYFTELLKGTSNSSISWIGSTQGFLLCCATVFAGQACDAGHARLTLIFGAVLVVFGLMMTSLCSSYWQLMLAQGICVGIGSGCCFITSVAVIPSYFTTRRAIAIGISASGSSVGGVIYPILFHRLEPHMGFAWATRIIGFMALGTLSFSAATLKPRATSRKPGASARKLLELSAFADPSFSLFSLAAFLSFIGLFIPFFYIEQYSQTQANLSPTLSFYTLPLLSAGSISGRIAPALLANRFGALSVLAVCTSISAVLAFAWFGINGKDSSPAAGMVIFALLYGFFSGAFVSLRTVVVVAITPKEYSHSLATRLGLNAFCAALGLLVGTPIAGVLVRQDNGWDKLRGFCGATIVLGSWFVTLAALAAMKKGREVPAAR